MHGGTQETRAPQVMTSHTKNGEGKAKNGHKKHLIIPHGCVARGRVVIVARASLSILLRAKGFSSAQLDCSLQMFGAVW